MLAKRGIKINRPSGEELRILHGEINDKKILFLIVFCLIQQIERFIYCS